MTLFLLGVTMCLVALFVGAGVRGRSFDSSVFWFVVLSAVFFLGAFVAQWANIGFDEANPVSIGVLTMCLGIISFVVGALLAKALRPDLGLNGSKRKKAVTNVTRIDADFSDRVLVILSAAILVPAWLYFLLLGSIPLLAGVQGVLELGYDGLGALQSARLLNTPHLSGREIPFKGVLDLMRSYGILFLIGICVTQLIQGAPKALRLAILIAAVATAVAGGQRWQLIYVVMTVLAAMFVSRHQGSSASRSTLLAWGSLLGIVAITLTAFQRRTQATISNLSDAISLAFTDLLERVLYEQSATPLLSFMNSSYKGGELKGSTYIQGSLSYIPGLGVDGFEVDFFQRIYGGSAAYTAAPGFFTEAYINFGLAGVVVISFLWGIVLALIDGSSRWRSAPLVSLGMKAAAIAMMAGSSFAGMTVIVSLALLLGYIIFVYRFALVVLESKSAPSKMGKSIEHASARTDSLVLISSSKLAGR